MPITMRPPELVKRLSLVLKWSTWEELAEMAGKQSINSYLGELIEQEIEKKKKGGKLKWLIQTNMVKLQ